MLKRIFGRHPSPALVISVISLFVALGGTTYAATGGSFILGQSNTASAQTALTSNNAGKALNVVQQSTGTGATALGLSVPTGKPPLTVNSSTKVTNLNADTLDGIDSSALVQGKGKTYNLAVAIARHTDGTFNHYTVAPAIVPGFFNVEDICPATSSSSNSLVGFINLAGSSENVFYRGDDAPNAGYWSVAVGGEAQIAADQTGDLLTATVNGLPGNVQTTSFIEIATIVNPTNCYFQIQVLTTHS